MIVFNEKLPWPDYRYRIIAEASAVGNIVQANTPKVPQCESVGSKASRVSQSVNQKAICDIATEVRDSVNKSTIYDKGTSTFANTDAPRRCCWSAERHKSFITGLEHKLYSISDNINLIWGGQDGKLLPSPWWYLIKVLLFPFIQVTVVSLVGKKKPEQFYFQNRKKNKEINEGFKDVCFFLSLIPPWDVT